MSTKLAIGTKLYKYNDNGDLEVIRITRASGNEYRVYKNNDKDTKYTKTASELHKYTIIRPDAIYNFALVINAESKNNKLLDVVVMMAKKNDKKPFVICRQMMQNLFTQMVTTETILGSCVSVDTCPEGVNFDMMLMCTAMVKTVTINGYIDDSPEDILKLNYKFITQVDKMLDSQKKVLDYEGLCSSVKELLFINGFWKEVDRTLKITVLKDKIENCTLNEEQLIYMENEISYIMENIHVLEYANDIDFSKIQSSYLLLRDSTNKLYLISYTQGNFIQQEHLNEEELKKFYAIKN